MRMRSAAPSISASLNRCAQDYGCPGVVITSEMDGKFLDEPGARAVLDRNAKSSTGLFVFVHPALKLNYSQQFDGYDTARSVGREFSLVMATIRLINSGVFDRHPRLTVHMSHLGGGLAGVLARVRGYQDKDFWGVKGHARHGRKAEKDFDYYINHNMLFDSAGFCCAIGAVERRAHRDSPPRGLCSPPTIRRRCVSGRRCAISSTTSAGSARTAR